MPDKLIATASIHITADSSAIWKALITPELIKQYLFGTETECDWKVGSPIFFRGEYQGNKYEDKGTILDIRPGTLLKYNYWSSMSGTSDRPEHYSNVTYQLTPNGSSTLLTITQDGITTEKSKQHSEQNWDYVLNAIKKLVEAK